MDNVQDMVLYLASFFTYPDIKPQHIRKNVHVLLLSALLLLMLIITKTQSMKK